MLKPAPVTTLIVLLVGVPAVAQDLIRGQQLVRDKCDTCHTQRDEKGTVLVGFLAGGKSIPGSGTAVSANLTPDPSGISYYDEKLFLQVLRSGQVGARKLSPLMNPAVFKSLTDDDLKSVFAYLKNVPPTKHRVDNTEPPTECRLCRHKHGGGETN